MKGALAFISMPGLAAVAVGFALAAAGALALLAALVLLAASLSRRELRRGAAGAGAAGAVLAGAGAALVAAGERAEHGGLADPAALVIAPLAVAAAVLAARLAGRTRAARRHGDLTGPPTRDR